MCEVYFIHRAGMWKSCTLTEVFKPEVLIHVYNQWQKFGEPIKVSAPGASSAQVDVVLERLKVGLEKLKQLPCCIDISQHDLQDIPEYK